MKNAHPTPKGKAGGAGQSAEIVASDGAAVEIVQIVGDRPMTDSLAVASEFGRRHDNVVRAIDALRPDLSPEFDRLNFEEIAYTDSRGRLQRMYRLTQAGFSVAVLGFTGRKAVQLRERFVTAFERMAAELQQRRTGAGLCAFEHLVRLTLERDRLEASASDAGRILGSLRARRRINDAAVAPLLAIVAPMLPGFEAEEVKP